MRTIALLALALVVAACAPPAGLVDESAPASTLEAGALLSQWNPASRRQEIRLVDPATGRDVPGHAAIALGQDERYASPHALSADGAWLAAVESLGQSCETFGGGASCWPAARKLHMLNLRTWHDVVADLPAYSGWIGPMAFSPDGARLALAHNADGKSALMVFDAQTGDVLARQEVDFRPEQLAFAQSGQALAVFGAPLGPDPGVAQPEAPRILLADAASLEPRWQETLAELISGSWCVKGCEADHAERQLVHWQPAAVFAPDGGRLYIVHADAPRLTTVDLDALAVSSVEIQAAQSWLERLLALTAGVAEAKGAVNGAYKTAALSPDGARLFVLGHAFDGAPDAGGHLQTSEASLGLQVIDVASGRTLMSQKTEAAGIWLTPNGSAVLLEGWDSGGARTEVLDAHSLKPITRLAGWQVRALPRPNGQSLLLGSQGGPRGTQLAVLDPETFAVRHAWSVDSFAIWLTR